MCGDPDEMIHKVTRLAEASFCLVLLTPRPSVLFYCATMFAKVPKALKLGHEGR